MPRATRQRRGRGRGFSLLELQIGLMLLAFSILALGSGLATTSRLLERLESHQRAILAFSENGRRAVLSTIRPIRDDWEKRPPVELLTLERESKTDDVTLIARAAPESR